MTAAPCYAIAPMAVWYFAYGSNMQTATFRGRRGIEFRRAVPVRLRGWRVVFDKPPLFPIGEAFANLVCDPDADALGVIYEIDEDDLEHVKRTEGVLIGNYALVEVEVEALDGSTRMAAASLSSDKRDAALQPSTRYMELIIAGAIEHGLPHEYIDFLRAIPVCQPSETAKQLRPLVDEFFKRR